MVPDAEHYYVLPSLYDWGDFLTEMGPLAGVPGTCGVLLCYATADAALAAMEEAGLPPGTLPIMIRRASGAP